MKKIIFVIVILLVLGTAVHRLTSNKARIEQDLAAQKAVNMAVPVTIIQTATDTLSHSFSVDGTLSAKDEVSILAETNGQVLEYYHDIGDYVQAGTSLALVDGHVTAAQLEMAKTSLANSERDLARFENLLKSGAAAQQTVDNLRLSVQNSRTNVIALEKQVANTTIRCPITGTITARNLEKGTVIGGGFPTFTVSNLSSMVIKVSLTEKEVAGVKEGMKVLVHLDALDKDYNAEVGTIALSADMSGRYPVEVRLRNTPQGGLRSGLSGSAKFALPGLGNMPTIPRKALVGGIKDPKVYVIEDGKAHLRPVSLAMVSNGEVAVSDGIKAGDKVVLSGQMNLLDGVAVKVVQ
ncbi:MAG TPA: efflux RND transporter periplasmic adaptor subunit [Fibrobacteraceae bacterium]|nr:efflux RND transporter periplasmic adaptor subunit [Fibrobacteraceae bacterium]